MKIWLIVAILLPVVLFLFNLFYSSIPSLEGTILIKGLKEPVKIVRDSQSMPYIQAKNPEDAFYAIGYVHAQDRLWGMDVLRRVSTGTMSELLGDKALDIDKFSRNLGIARYSERDLEYYEEFYISILQRYSDGINEYARNNPLPPEYLIIWGEWTDWKPSDTLSVFKFMSLTLSLSWGHEFLRYKLDGLFGREKSDMILGARDEFRRFQALIVQDHELSSELIGRSDTPIKDSYVGGEEFIEFNPLTGGSNAWAISGEHTASGKPILSNDPHMALQIPTFGYMIDVVIENGPAFSGISLPGTPSLLSGKTKTLAFANTALMADTIDIYKIQRAEDGYVYDNRTLPFKTVEETIQIRGKDPYKMKIEISRFGPILDSSIKDASVFGPFYYSPNSTSTYALRWSATEDPDTSYQGIYNFLVAETMQEVTKAFSEIQTLYLSHIYATETEIGYRSIGRIPIRDFKANRVLPGWKKGFDWKGYVPFDQMVYVKNPQKGYVVSGNNHPASKLYKYKNSYGDDYLEPRGEVISDIIADMINKKKKVDVYDMLAIQCNKLNIVARDTIKNLNERRGLNLKEFEDWDFYMEKDSQVSYLWGIFHKNLAVLLMEDEVGDNLLNSLLKNYWYRAFVGKVFSSRNLEMFSDLCDDRRTLKQESCLDLAKKAYELSLGQHQNQSWGEVHKMYHKHVLFGGIWGLDSLFSRRIPAGGTHETAYSAANSWHSTYEGVVSATARMVYDWNSLSSLAIANVIDI